MKNSTARKLWMCLGLAIGTTALSATFLSNGGAIGAVVGLVIFSIGLLAISCVALREDIEPRNTAPKPVPGLIASIPVLDAYGDIIRTITISVGSVGYTVRCYNRWGETTLTDTSDDYDDLGDIARDIGRGIWEGLAERITEHTRKDAAKAAGAEGIGT